MKNILAIVSLRSCEEILIFFFALDTINFIVENLQIMKKT